MKERADPRLSRGGGSAASRRGYWFLFGVWAASLALGLLFTGLWRERALDSQFSPSSAWQEPMLYGLGGAFGFLREAAGWTLVLRYPLRRCLLPFGIACFLRWGRALAGLFFVAPSEHGAGRPGGDRRLWAALPLPAVVGKGPARFSKFTA